MRTVFGVTNVSSAGTAVQLNNATNRVKYIKVKALAGNSGIAYVGASDVSATANSYELSATNELELNFNNLMGEISVEIGNLVNLVELNLMYNYLNKQE